MGIDYFSRKVFATEIRTKEASKIVDFLNKTRLDYPFRTLKTDNGKEFMNSLVRDFCKKAQIHHETSIPYWHSSNERVERVIQTLRDALKKTKGVLRIRLARVVKNYNNSFHRRIGMSPNDAMKTANRDLVMKNCLEYSKEFKTQPMNDFKIGDLVLLRNEIKETKNDKNYELEATVIKKIGRNTFLVNDEFGQEHKRHSLQLKILKRGDVVLDDVKSSQ